MATCNGVYRSSGSLWTLVALSLRVRADERASAPSPDAPSGLDLGLKRRAVVWLHIVSRGACRGGASGCGTSPTRPIRACNAGRHQTCDQRGVLSADMKKRPQADMKVPIRGQ